MFAKLDLRLRLILVRKEQSSSDCRHCVVTTEGFDFVVRIRDFDFMFLHCVCSFEALVMESGFGSVVGRAGFQSPIGQTPLAQGENDLMGAGTGFGLETNRATLKLGSFEKSRMIAAISDAMANR